ncbi:MAG: MMPL family transporter [Planctomycetia bacterium]|jgi:hopanoid biosynthesis associated RND transporter like protein HpnN
MTAERKPLEEPSLLAVPLGRVTSWIVRRPAPVLAVAFLLAVVAVVITIGGLGFHTSRLDLINPQCAHNQLWVDYINEFGDQDDVVVLVEGDDREQVIPVLEDISARLLENDRYFKAVLHEVDLSTVRSKGLYYLPEKELKAIDPFLCEYGPIIDGDWQQLQMSHMIDGLCLRLYASQTQNAASVDTVSSTVVLAQLDQLCNCLIAGLGSTPGYSSPWPMMPDSVSMLNDLGPYLLANEGRWGLILLRLAKDETDEASFAPESRAIDELRNVVAQVKAAHPDVSVGLTGLPIMENDEMRSSQSAMLRASLLSLAGVACLFIAGFGGVRHPLMTVGALLLAMTWSFGYITVAIGHLNILSIAFGVILIGLGIDFGIHYVARYVQLRHEHELCETALVHTARSVGPGIITGAVTTAIAFFMAGFTDFTGVAELGVIAGGGIVLCCIAAIVVLPAMIRLSDGGRTAALKPLPPPLDIPRWLAWLFRRPGWLFGMSLAITIVLGIGISQLYYDHNLLNLQAEGVESIELEHKLLTESDQSVWFALSLTDSREELLARKQKFLALPSVERVDEIASLLPKDQEKKQPLIQQISHRLAPLPERPPAIPIDPPGELGQALARAQLLVKKIPNSDGVSRKLTQIRGQLRRLTDRECVTRLGECQHRIAADLLNRLFVLREMANPEPPRLEDLPESLVTRFVGKQKAGHPKRFLMKIYAKGNIWDMAAMRQFVTQVRQVDPKVTGNPLQTYEASLAMKSSYEKAAWFALVAIVFILILDFESVSFALLAMIPLGLGMLQMFGILGMIGIPLNPANMIVLPLILGIGIDDGVHVVHDFRRQRGPYRMSASTASAVLITSITTMVGFGSMMIASHRGLQSLGRVLTIGVTCCLFTSLIMLPAILAWMTRHRSEEEEETLDEVSTSSPHRIRRIDSESLPSPVGWTKPSREPTVQK